MAVYLIPVKSGRRVVIDKAVIFFGRHPDCDVILNTSRKISRKHCCIAQVNDLFFVRDLGSMNGVHVNGKRVKRFAQIHVGDEVMIGDVAFRFETDRSLAQRKNQAPQPEAAQRRRTAPPPLTRRDPIDVSMEYPIPLPEPSDDDEEPAPLADDDSFVQGDAVEDDVIVLDSHDDLSI